MICKDDDDDDADKEEEEKHDRIGGCHKEVGWTFVSYADKLLQWARTRRPLWKHEKKRKKKKTRWTRLCSLPTVHCKNSHVLLLTFAWGMHATP